ncbi:hypothetical protein AAZV13_13G227201 [Glycine max]
MFSLLFFFWVKLSCFLSCQSRGAERDHVQRKALHEVHSGPNPISNSIPQQKLKNIQRNHMH